MKNLTLSFKICIVLFLINVNALAQISGRVLDKHTHAPLSGANIYLMQNKSGCSSNDLGFFKLHVKDYNKADTLVVFYLGYKRVSISLEHHKQNSPIYLEPDPLSLNETINIYAERLDLSNQEIPHLREKFDQQDIERYGTSELSHLFKKVPSVRVEGNDTC